MSITYDRTAREMVLTGANELNPTLRIAVGVKRNEDTEKESPAYMTVKVPGRPSTLSEALEQLAKLADVMDGKPNLLRVAYPKDTAASLVIAPRMVPSRVVMLYCVLGGWKVPSSMTRERIESALTALGKADLIPAYCPPPPPTTTADTPPALPTKGGKGKS